ncbi:DUF1810 domain-containing protein [Tunturiibacter gelidoferens]|jgi:uncharacterized protein (DUF1810 family)|uniref:Uncharacterized protein (DUF1810 family) n=1 Tax=Tunturiibacter gelidiferens TaxID=3069689 RepID=A0A9X0U2A0_9BACT|nr:DUF1810 domain-containing protein [Edaphobacter lichenicola]MBB5327083.1 uncharacterized protein (DUF1810 family) [Edaphobacter lichenicola]
MAREQDVYDLQRFLEAQAEVYEQACDELRAGRKRSHWMWFVFPQIYGLGSSPMAVRYAISSLAEARAYLDHVVLGSRLQEAAGIVVGVQGKTVEEIFGSPDDMKFHSSMTLFAKAAAPITKAAEGSGGVFEEALAKYFHGAMDQGTMQRF